MSKNCLLLFQHQNKYLIFTCSGSESLMRKIRLRHVPGRHGLIGRRRDAQHSISTNACKLLFWAFQSRTCSLHSMSLNVHKKHAKVTKWLIKVNFKLMCSSTPPKKVTLHKDSLQTKQVERRHAAKNLIIYVEMN